MQKTYLCIDLKSFYASVECVELGLDIDGLRLDVAYCLSDFYLKELRRFTSTLKEDFVLMGETLHGDYNMYMNDEKCHSVTNYECLLP